MVRPMVRHSGRTSRRGLALSLEGGKDGGDQGPSQRGSVPTAFSFVQTHSSPLGFLVAFCQ